MDTHGTRTEGATTDRSDYALLAAMSARVGGQLSLIQGPGGNTSLKDGDAIWIKASGRWLADAEREGIFARLSLSAARAGIDRGEADDFAACLRPDSPAGLKPSIETAFHVLMPHRVVVHAHTFNTMAVSVMADGERRFRELTSSAHRVAWIPYRRPGGPLARTIAEALASASADVLLLQNHGVVVGAENPEAAEALLLEVDGLLALPERERSAFEARAAAAAGTDDYEPDPASHDLATTAYAVDVAGAAALIPDQVVFLGGAICVADARWGVDASARVVEAATGIRPVYVILRGVGAYRLRDRSRGADSVIDGLIGLLRRLPAGTPVHGLTLEETAELLGWPAEHYRQALDRARS